MNERGRSRLLQRCKHFLQNETVLAISLLAALLSCLFVPPSAAYLGYLDLQVLALLFCLMAVVAGLEHAGLFAAAARLLCRRVHSLRALALALVGCCFFSSMLITNDVALLTFVPFAILVLELSGQGRYAAYIIVLQTVAANIGSSLTPVGNPQNLFLYSRFAIPAGSFFSVTLPLVAAGGVLLLLLLLPLPKLPLSLPKEAQAKPLPRGRTAVFLLLFLLCLLAVFHLLPYQAVFLFLVVLLLLWDRSLLRRVDYPLLATFVCFFVFVGNLGEIPAVSHFVGSLLQGRELLVSALASQLISNVPAAVMLSNFTEGWRGLLLGVNIGGLGTPVASLASLISLKFFSRSYGSSGRYLRLFSLINFALLALLLAGAALLA